MSISTLGLKLAVALLLSIIIFSYAANWNSTRSLYDHIVALDEVSDCLATGDSFTTSTLGMLRLAGENTHDHTPADLRQFYEIEKNNSNAALALLTQYVENMSIDTSNKAGIEKLSEMSASYYALRKITDSAIYKRPDENSDVIKRRMSEVHKLMDDIFVAYGHIQTGHKMRQEELCRLSEEIWRATSRTFLIQISVVLVLMVLTVAYLDRIVLKMFEVTERLALHDKLTGALNRHALNRVVKDKSTGADKHRDYSVILLDIDHFKAFNDTYGHDVGDMALKVVSNTISSSVRKQDKVFRYGGEEFLVFLPATPESGAAEVAEKIRANIASAPFALPNSTQQIKITISAGVAAAQQEKTFDVLVKEADTRLYRAKEAGRNQVVASGSD